MDIQTAAHAYKNANKSYLFKNTNKLKIAHTIAADIGIEQLLKQSMFIIPHLKLIYIDYTIFKLYANPDNYEQISAHIISILDQSILEYNCTNISINFDTLTVSAIERYKPFIYLFFNQCKLNNSQYCSKLCRFTIYNTPSIIDMIYKFLKPFIDHDAFDKVVKYNKAESPALIAELFK
jgi:hypothetical protein